MTTQTISESVDRERTRRVLTKIIEKHYGPGNHASGTPQTTHGRGGRDASTGDIKEATDTQGGITIRTMSGDRPQRGFSVAIKGPGVKLPKARATADRVGKFIRDNWAQLSKKGFYLGTWKDDENGVVWLDVSKVMDSPKYVQAFEAAVKYGRSIGEEAIYDLQAGKEIMLNDNDIAAYRTQLAAAA